MSALAPAGRDVDLTGLDFDPPCELPTHPEFGNGPAAWIVHVRYDCPCPPVGDVTWLVCPDCLDLTSHPRVGLTCGKCGKHTHPLGSLIVSVEPLRRAAAG